MAKNAKKIAKIQGKLKKNEKMAKNGLKRHSNTWDMRQLGQPGR